ncbi:MAG: hypothetical protein ACYDB7_12100 [Mycobacteriales bacterium]
MTPVAIAASARVDTTLGVHQRQLMRGRWDGSTATSYRAHDREEGAATFAELRRLYVELDHDSWETSHGIGSTIGPEVRI